MPGKTLATPEHAAASNEPCTACHDVSGGYALNLNGLSFAASGYSWPPSGGFRALGAFKKPVRLVIGFVHITASFIWLGAILYVHLLLRPGYAMRGLPRSEVILGLVSMAFVGATGALLTYSKIASLDVLLTSRWGHVLMAKMAIYAVMVCSALIAITFVGPRLKRPGPRGGPDSPRTFDAESLAGFDGHEGRPAYVAYGGKVYDVSGLKLWRGGAHMKHRAGHDQSAALPGAPHGVEKLEPLKVVGLYEESSAPALNTAQKAFYVIAYLNLSLVFVVLFVIALWRWGL